MFIYSVIIYYTEPSGTPQNLMQNATASTSFTVTWGNPLDNETNGIIVGFTVQLYGNGSNSYEVNTSRTVRIYEATNLESNKVYTVNVSAYIYKDWSRSSSYY